MSKYIDAEKLKELIDEKWKEFANKNVKAGGGKWDAEISTYLSVLRLIDSLQQEQTEVNFEDIEFLLNKVEYMRGYWVKTNPDCAEIVKDFNKRLNAKKEKAE